MENESIGRVEFVFVYDVKDANPNGDPAEGNRPRMDDYTEQNIVSDVRIKRTVRDYLDRKYGTNDGLKIFIKEYRKEDGNLKTKEEVLKEFENEIENKDVFEVFWDLRAFGATLAIKGKRITQTGPVQLRFGRSIHKVEPELIEGTTVMPSKEGKGQGTMTEYWKVPYSLIATYGVVNNHVAQDVGLTRKDVGILWEAIWNGTADLNTRSKIGHTPRLLMIIEYKEDYHTGNLDYLIRMCKKDGTEITARYDEKNIGKSVRGPDEYYLDLSELFRELECAKNKIRKIWIIKHPELDVKVDTSADDKQNENSTQSRSNCSENVANSYSTKKDKDLKEYAQSWGDQIKIIETEYIDWNNKTLQEFAEGWGIHAKEG